jgi:P63C domain-containing protein
MPSFADAKNLQPFVASYIEGGLKTVVYRDLRGRVMAGYNALVLPQLCDVYLEARRQGALTKSQEALAMAAEILARSLSKVGIIALVDEATGYQEVRDRVALQQILNKYIGLELAKWVRTFPQEFYKEIFRLKGWTFDPDSSRRPILMANITIDLVYRRLAPGVLAKLKELSPKDEHGRRKHKLFQWLSEDIGHPALKDHLSGLIFLAKSQDQWDAFCRSVDRVVPRFGDTLPLYFPEEALSLETPSDEPKSPVSQSTSA